MIHTGRSLISGTPVRVIRTIAPRVIKVYPAWSTTPAFRLADGSDRNSELIEVTWLGVSK